MAIYKFKMFGVIASEIESIIFGDEDLITLKDVENNLVQANGDDIEVDLSSVGGLVNVGVDIYFELRDYKRNNPNSEMILNIKSQAASMASHIASGEFWDLITVEDISSYMLHNPENYMHGDYIVMQENADFLQRLSSLYSMSYIKRSGKSEKEIRGMMDKTTFIYGEEVVQAGFADEVLTTGEEINRESMIAHMQLKYDSMVQKFQQIEMKNEDFKKAVAKLDINKEHDSGSNNNKQQPATGGNNNKQEGRTMAKTVEELRTENPDLYKETIQAGSDQAKSDMIANNKAIMEFKNKDEFKNLEFIQNRCEESLENSENIADLKMAVQALMLDPKNQASLDSPDDIDGGDSSTVSGEEGEKEHIKEF